MNILTIDVGGTNVKILATGQKIPLKIASGPTMTPTKMVSSVKKLTADWNYEAVSIGYPGPVLHGHILQEPRNLAPGWVEFDFKKAFGCPVKVINDASMQALGCYKGRRMLFLGLGTGLGATMIVDGAMEPMELGRFPYRGATYEDYVGVRGLKRYGKKKWRKYVADVVKRLRAALASDDIVLGGGNAKNLKKLPKGCRRGDNSFAFIGGFRLWAKGERE